MHGSRLQLAALLPIDRVERGELLRENMLICYARTTGEALNPV